MDERILFLLIDFVDVEFLGDEEFESGFVDDEVGVVTERFYLLVDGRITHRVHCLSYL